MNAGSEPSFPWPRASEPPLSAAVLRAAPEDFVVEEQMPFTLEGRGEHLWVQLRKRGWNSEQAARTLARLAGIGRRDVGYAGMKDRHAVAVQWFSLHLAGRADPDWHGLPEGLEVLSARRHGRKLKTGALAGNCFTLTLRACQGEAADLARGLERLRREGAPNYFGEQRFGHDGANVAHARALFAGTEVVRDRHRRGLYLSAARSFLFNEVLAERLRRKLWQEPLPGDACVLAGSHSYFVAETVDETLRRRLAEHDIHLSGPLWGAGEPPTRDAARALEDVVAAGHPDLTRGLAAEGLRQERRALRVIPQDLTADSLADGAWRLRFCLPAGSYATAVVRELAVYRDAGRAGEEGE
jgi:tRNA pseudouridine13 synthase